MRGSRVMANRAEIVKTGMIRAGKSGLQAPGSRPWMRCHVGGREAERREPVHVLGARSETAATLHFVAMATNASASVFIVASARALTAAMASPSAIGSRTSK